MVTILTKYAFSYIIPSIMSEYSHASDTLYDERRTWCLQSLVAIVAAGVEGAAEPDPRYVAVIEESRISYGQKGSKLGCLGLCQATCYANFVKDGGQIKLEVNNPTNLNLCTEEPRDAPTIPFKHMSG